MERLKFQRMRSCTSAGAIKPTLSPASLQRSSISNHNFYTQTPEFTIPSPELDHRATDSLRARITQPPWTTWAIIYKTWFIEILKAKIILNHRNSFLWRREVQTEDLREESEANLLHQAWYFTIAQSFVMNVQRHHSHRGCQGNNSNCDAVINTWNKRHVGQHHICSLSLVF